MLTFWRYQKKNELNQVLDDVTFIGTSRRFFYTVKVFFSFWFVFNEFNGVSIESIRRC